MIWRLVLATVFALLAVAWGIGWGVVPGPVRWAGVVVFAALAAANLLQALSRKTR